MSIEEHDPFALAEPSRRDLLTEHPATRHDHLIVRFPNRDDGFLAYGWFRAAERIAGTFSGEAQDDALLLPYLYLFRHAFELELKQAIRYAVGLRRLRGDEDRDLASQKVARRLQYEHGHKLLALADEMDAHLASFEIEPLPAEVRRVLELISSLDRVGEAFRYTGSLPEGQDSVDFQALHVTLLKAYELASVTQDVLSPIAEGLEYEFDARREMEAEMRAEYADYEDYEHW